MAWPQSRLRKLWDQTLSVKSPLIFRGFKGVFALVFLNGKKMFSEAAKRRGSYKPTRYQAQQTGRQRAKLKVEFKLSLYFHYYRFHCFFFSILLPGKFLTRLDQDFDWRGEWNRASECTWCSVNFSFCFSRKCCIIWRENLAVSRVNLTFCLACILSSILIFLCTYM